MTLPPASSDRTLQIYLSLAQYPILSTHIRARMRRELFERGVIKPQAFEAEVREKAIRSQALEGVQDPFLEEPADVWELRLARIRDYLTDFYFAYNLPYDLFEQIVREALAERGAGAEDIHVTFNPELAPQNMLFEQAMAIERMPVAERQKHEARLQEIKVVLIRTMISDQLAYVNIAKEWFTIADLNEIRMRKIGSGKVGGKAAGMLLAARILQDEGDERIRNVLRIPETYFIGADLTYTFMALNGLMHWADQKYKLEEQIRSEYPKLQEEFLQGQFPNDILEKLRELLQRIGPKPIIVRSSSLLEDNFGTSFAGKYESHFCPNQGSLEENLRDLTTAIIRIYASILNPDALLYRRAKGLQDYDERMAVMIQVVQGEKFGRYYLPLAAGVAFSRNLYRWSPQIRREDGFVRLVWGLGTRAVDRVGNDYPRLVALSHPLLQPEDDVRAIQKYSQHYVDLIDLEANRFATLPVREVLHPQYAGLRYLVQLDQGGFLTPVHHRLRQEEMGKAVITFDGLLRLSPFASCLRDMLRILEKNYHSPVDTEFALTLAPTLGSEVNLVFSLLQCRPQSQMEINAARLPKHLTETDIVFSTSRMAPQGRVSGIRYVLFISPERYFALPNPTDRARIGIAIGQVNVALREETFICVGPGRWGTNNPDLGLLVGYADIYNARALVELTGEAIGINPEASFGTHFFQDLVESNIYPLALCLDDPDSILNKDFFYHTPNRLKQYVTFEAPTEACLHLICVEDYRPGFHLELVMDDDAGKSVAFLEVNE